MTEYYFVSCDIVAHSAEPNIEKQKERVLAINNIVRSLLDAYPRSELIWASGGDGGHVALPLDVKIDAFLHLIFRLRNWSVEKEVPLRVSANVGLVETITGADGRKQLVGSGINLAGHLVSLAGPRRVVVSSQLRDRIQGFLAVDCRFHDEQEIELKGGTRESVCLLSVAGEFESAWDDTARSDRSLLVEAVRSEDSLRTIFRARRLLEINSSDAAALSALQKLTSGSRLTGGDRLIESLIFDERFGPEVVQVADLIQRRAGETLCEINDQGETMFWILQGRVAGFLRDRPDKQCFLTKPDFVLGAGRLTGELAFGLRRKRTATLCCLEETALLGFSYEKLLAICRNDAMRKHLDFCLDSQVTPVLVENVWNTAKYFRGCESNELKDITERWPGLMASVKRTRIRWETRIISQDHEAFAPKCLCILVSGKMIAKNSRRTVLQGTDYPILYSDSPTGGDVFSQAYELLEDVDLLTIGWDAFLRLGPQAYQTILDQVVNNLETCRGSNQKARDQKPEALETWKQKLDFLQQQEAISSGAAERFELAKEIERAIENIKRLENQRSARSA